jgi:hypothetical protein
MSGRPLVRHEEKMAHAWMNSGFSDDPQMDMKRAQKAQAGLSLCSKPLIPGFKLAQALPGAT